MKIGGRSWCSKQNVAGLFEYKTNIANLKWQSKF